MNEIDFRKSANNFLSKVETQLLKASFQVPAHWNVDHICYRVETYEQYELMRKFFATVGLELIESQVNGRPITTYKLTDPLSWGMHQIDLIELPAPKVGRKTQTGWEHIEIVCDVPFDELAQRFPNSSLSQSGLLKTFNQEFEVKMDGCAVKFHHLSLESVVTLEANRKIFQSMVGLQVLETLREFEPLIAGTYPLGVQTIGSDIDVLLFAPNLEDLFAKFDEFSNLKGFERYWSNGVEEKYVLCRFEFLGVKFELFGQQVRSIRQRAYKHFQIEERLLKLGGKSFREKMVALRNAGERTEPAFAKALALSGDPYLALLEIHKWSEFRLMELLQTAGLMRG